MREIGIDKALSVLYYKYINASSMRKPDEVFCYTYYMSDTVLFIDGENFLHKVEDVLKKKK